MVILVTKPTGVVMPRNTAKMSVPEIQAMTQPPILLTDSAPRSKALNNELSVLYLNARSVKSVTRTINKLHQLKDAVSMGNFTIIAITGSTPESTTASSLTLATLCVDATEKMFLVTKQAVELPSVYQTMCFRADAKT